MMNLRGIAKRSLKVLFLFTALPFFATFLIVRATTRSEDSFTTFSQILSLAPGKAGVYLRAAFYRLACPGTSDDISIGFLTTLSHRDTSISRGVYIGSQCNIGMCQIGENTLIGSGVHILSGKKQHNFDDPKTPIQQQGGTFEKISIGRDCWVGNSSIIMVSIEHRVIVAAGSVVVRGPESGSVIAGNPAKKIKDRPSEGYYQ
jgi:acetyltransferase-like isoleucine patch superfamily enzyme